MVKNHQEKLLFLVSGGVQYLIDISLFTLLVFIFGNHLSINTVSRCGAGIAGFFINGFVVFKSLKGKSLRQLASAALKFLILLSVMTLLSSAILSFFVNLSPLCFIFAKAVIEIILAVVSFFIQKFIVYSFSAKSAQRS